MVGVDGDDAVVGDTIVEVDGGMADNIRPAMYGSRYEAMSVDRPLAPAEETVTVAGKYCESGDVLIRDIELPRLAPGDLLAVPMAGAYTLAMASNYNLASRPAVVLVKDGQARLMQRRETYDDLVARDLPLAPDTRHAPRPTHYAVRSTHYPVRTTQPTANFTKYHAHGNDYIVLDPADWPAPPDAEIVRRICDRHRGVGADGLLWGPTSPPSPLLRGEGSKDSPFPGKEGGQGSRFALRLFNPDGGEFEISGNGLRIFARYLWDRGLPAGPDFTILTPAGPVVAHVLDATGERIAVDMGRLSFRSEELGLVGPPREVIEEEVEVAGRRLRISAVTIGNPHCVVFAESLPFAVPPGADRLVHLAQTLGPALERLPLYPDRTNVQFAEVIDRHTLRIAIWERGAGYTLASGTSSCAAAAAAIRTGRCVSPVTVRMPGGEMWVEVADDWSVRLTGTVTFVCQGEYAVM